MKFLRKNVLELSYLTEKRTLIRDWRLAILYYALLGCVVAYVVTSLVSGKSYIMTEVPTGVASAWGLGGDDFYELQKNAQKNETEGGNGFCDDLNKYTFIYNDEWVYDNMKCGFFTADEMISKLPSGNVIFFATHVDTRLTARYTATRNATGHYMCPDATIKANFDGTDATQVIEGRCTHSKEYNYIIPGMEGSKMAFDHSYDTTSEQFSGTKPKTYVRKKDSDKDEHVFEPGESVELTMNEWLDLAGVDLDKPFNDQPRNFEGALKGLNGTGADITDYPHPRLSGVRLNILVRYFNYDLHKDVHTTMGDDTVYAIVTVSPILGWFSKGHDITYRAEPTDLTDPIDASDGKPEGYFHDMYKYGILFDIQQTGLIGQLDPVFIILTLTSGLVLLGVAGTIVNLVAKFGLGELSKNYKLFIQEECDIELEAARFTAQSIVASRAFKVADKDGEGQLDFTELKAVVSACFSDQFADHSGKGKLQKEMFSGEEIHSMTLFLMRAADPELDERIMERREKTVAELEASTISLNQWQALSTSDYIDHDSVKNIIARNRRMKKLAHKN